MVSCAAPWSIPSGVPYMAYSLFENMLIYSHGEGTCGNERGGGFLSGRRSAQRGWLPGNRGDHANLAVKQDIRRGG